MISELKSSKRDAVKAAKDLCYSEKIIKQLEAAKSTSEISRIMSTARKEKFK